MKLGELNIYILQDGLFRIIHDKLKTGAATAPVSMFSSDSVLLGINLLLIRTTDCNILIDCGIGTKISHEYYRKYKMQLPRQLHTELQRYGLKRDDIDYVINTHLHFDHGGGNTLLSDTKELQPAFSNARYIVQKKEYDYALKQAKINNSSYFTENFSPLVEQGLLDIIDGDLQLCKEVKLQLVGGHTPGLQIVRISSADAGAVFLSDLIPTPWHVNNSNLPGIDYDNALLEQQKQKILAEIKKENLLMFFQHSPRFFAGHLNKSDQERYTIKKVKID